MPVRLIFHLVPVLLMLALDSPLIRNRKPVREAAVGAGEGPAWDGKRYLYFTGDGRISRRDHMTGKVEVFRENAGGANGLLFDHQGRLVVCEGGNRRVVRIEADGSTTVLAEGYGGKRFNSPNDLTIDSRGRIYFSDPRYGNRAGMEMLDTDGTQVEGVYRIDAPGKATRIIAREVDRPNGLLVSARDEHLYVADNNNSNQPEAPRKLWRFRLRADGSVDSASRQLIFDWGSGRGPDGLKMDRAGRLYVAAGRTKPRPPFETDERKGGVYILSPGGELLDFLPVPDDEVTNCALGGPDRDVLFITAGGNLWWVKVDARSKVVPTR